MVHIVEVSAGFMLASAVLALILLVVAVRSYWRERERAIIWIACAFAVFMIKSLVVGVALITGLVEHGSLELVDAAGDLMTIFLFLAPLVMSRR